MEGLNKIIFLVLGLVAVIIFFAVLTGRINLKGKLPTFSDPGKKETITPTPAKTEPTTAYKGNNSINPTPQNQPYTKNGQAKTATKKITAIPATGVSEMIIPLSIMCMGMGMYLRYKRS